MDFSEISPQVREEVEQDSDLKTSINGSFISLNTRTNSLELPYAQYQAPGNRRFKQRRPLTHIHKRLNTDFNTNLRERKQERGEKHPPNLVSPLGRQEIQIRFVFKVAI